MGAHSWHRSGLSLTARAFLKSPLKVEIQLWVDCVPQFPTWLLPSPHLLPRRVSLMAVLAAGTTSPSGRLAGMQKGACLAQFLVSLKAVSQVLCKASRLKNKDRKRKERKIIFKKEREKGKGKKGEAKKRKSHQMMSSMPASAGCTWFMGFRQTRLCLSVYYTCAISLRIDKVTEEAFTETEGCTVWMKKLLII